MAVVDGRVRRGARNRDAIVDALLACYEAGQLRPSVHEVAARAGVSVRSVHNHFEDVESLRAEVVERQWDRFSPLIGEVATVDDLIAARVLFFEAVATVRRAASLSVYDSPAIARNLARLDRVLRQQLDAMFIDVDNDTLDALELVTSWDTWNRLRVAQGCSVPRARRIIERAVHALISPD